MQSSSVSAVAATKGMRGKHTPGNKLVMDVVRDHIEQFNPSISHYRREHAPNRRYLPSDINVRYMFADFKEKHPHDKCSYESYRKQIRQLNISFAKLGEEQCDRCTTYELHKQSHIEPRAADVSIVWSICDIFNISV